MATSTAPAFMNALHDALSARAALAGVRVNYGPALPDPGRESVNILGMSGEQSLEDQLRETLVSPTMTNTVRVAAVESVSLEVGASDTTRSALLTIGVRVQARI